MTDRGTNSEAPPERPRLAAVLILVVSILALLHAVSFLGAGPIDDDVITYRYARNWVEGHGPVFNPGERFEGFTIPLWVMILALGMKASIAPEWLSVSISILSVGVAAFALGCAWRRRYPGSFLPFPALFLAVSPTFAWHGVAGLGTTMLAALLALWFDAYDRACRAGRDSRGAAVFLALACLLRQECALFVLFYLWLEVRRRPSAWLALPVLSLAGWTLFRLVYFGRLLPITYYVKKLSFFDDLSFGAKYLKDSTQSAGVGWLVLASLLGLLARRFGRSRNPERSSSNTDAFRAALWGVWLHTLYVVYVGGDYVPFARFFAPTLPLLAFVGMAAMKDASPSPRFALLPMLATLASVQWVHRERIERFGEHQFFNERWLRLGDHFRKVTPADTSVAIAPIGAFGWASGLEIIDILGVTHDGMLGAEPNLEITMKGHQRTDADWILDRKPDFVILANGVRHADGKLAINPWEYDLFVHPRFRQDYVFARVPIPGDAPLDVFQRSDTTPLPGAQIVRNWADF